MPKRYLIIDGYNFLYAAGMMPRTITPAGLQRARVQLFRFLEHRLTAAERDRTDVVFDVRQNRQEVPARQHHAGMTIRNAVEHPDADSLIEELIRRHPAPKQLLVVSSDHRLHKAAKAGKARPLDSEVFHDQLLNRQQQKRTNPRAAPLPKSFPYPAQDLPAIEISTSDTELEIWQKRINELFDEH